MAFQSKKEFADACGMTTGNLSNYIARKKVLLSGDLIDDSINPNKEFLIKWSTINAAKISANLKSADAGDTEDIPQTNFKGPTVPNIQPPASNITIPNTKANKAAQNDVKGIMTLEREKKQLDVIKTGEEITHLKLKNEKLQGDNIPTNMVREVFRRHSQNISASFKSGIENLIVEFEKSANLKRDKVAALRGKMITIINEAIENAIKESKKEISNIVQEVSVKKGVGERE